MAMTPEKIAQRDHFHVLYERMSAPVMRAIERRVCGCSYGASSWTTKAEAELIAQRLDLRAGTRLLDVGAGAGWPALYIAETTGCQAVLVDLPLSGLITAAARARQDGLSGLRGLAVADASALPFPDGSFDAVSHSDLLCCLADKAGALTACRRVLRPGGTMVFSVILVPPGLSLEAYRLGVENGPEFIDSERDYPTLLAETGWHIVECLDVTQSYAASCRRQLEADLAHADDLRALIGPEDYAARVADWPEKIAAIAKGVLRRELFTVTAR